ncbi:hypothetical protein KC851_00725 [Candidatus Kaiserbacteria bacterium]|nr:hypothetical protein [Candidatus Kaiserbacteria bacterium]
MNTVRITIINSNGEEISKETKLPVVTRPWPMLKMDTFGSLLHLLLKQVQTAHANRTSVGWGG